VFPFVPTGPRSSTGDTRASELFYIWQACPYLPESKEERSLYVTRGSRLRAVSERCMYQVQKDSGRVLKPGCISFLRAIGLRKGGCTRHSSLVDDVFFFVVSCRFCDNLVGVTGLSKGLRTTTAVISALLGALRRCSALSCSQPADIRHNNQANRPISVRLADPTCGLDQFVIGSMGMGSDR
jgi:hypothetical protein